jgi:uncharacterized protein (TIGR03083 family)
MTEKTHAYIAAIESHSAGFADASRDNLNAPVEHCPAWTVADLVWHLTEVHWFWSTIAEDRLTEPPTDVARPTRMPDDGLVDAFKAGAKHLVEVLGVARQQDPVWTWAPAQKDIAFITRHQVQEAAVHHWDAVNAAGGTLVVSASVAVDSIEEFLTFSVSSEADPAEPVRPALGGAFALTASDVDAAWTIRDGAVPGTITFERGHADGVPAMSGTASDLLLWLYDRVEIDTAPIPHDVVKRFRTLCFTD